MYNPRNYARRIEKILGTPEYLTGEIERDPLAFVSSFLDKKFDSNERCAKLIDAFDDKYSKYKDTNLINWDEKDAKQFTDDLKAIFSA